MHFVAPGVWFVRPAVLGIFVPENKRHQYIIIEFLQCEFLPCASQEAGVLGLEVLQQSSTNGVGPLVFVCFGWILSHGPAMEAGLLVGRAMDVVIVALVLVQRGCLVRVVGQAEQQW